MKKSILLLLLVLIPVLALAQTAEEYLNKGIAKGELGDYRGALQDFDKAIELDPNLADAYFNRWSAKTILVVLGDDKEGAIQDLSKAIQLNPNDSRVIALRKLQKERRNR